MKKPLLFLLAVPVVALTCGFSGPLWGAWMLPQTEAHFDAEVSPVLQSRGGGFSHVYVWAELNDTIGGWFLLDSGAQSNGLRKHVAEALGLKLRRAGRSGGVGASVKAYRTTTETLQMGPMRVTSPRFIVTDYESEEADDVLGVLGSDVFEQSVIVYDHSRPRVEVFDPATYKAPPVEWQECVILADRPFARMLVEGQEVLLEIDTGGGEGVLLTTPAVERLKLDDGRPWITDRIHGPYGSVEIAKTNLATVEVGAMFFEDTLGTLGIEHKGWLGSREHDGLIGAPLMVHLIVTFDYVQGRVAFTDRHLYPLLEGGTEGKVSMAYSEYQATGAPDTIDRATYGNAWFPADSHGQHWLELTYSGTIQPEQIKVWGTFAQEGITGILGITREGQELAIDWDGTARDSLADGIGLTEASVQVSAPIQRLRIEIDCSKADGTNVIDAVGLVDAEGTTHWAQEASADGSLYGFKEPTLSPREMLEAHARRLKDIGLVENLKRVRQQIAVLGER